MTDFGKTVKNSCLRTFGLCAALWAGLWIAGSAAPVCAAVPVAGDDKIAVTPEVPIHAYAFRLEDVRLLDSPFKDAMSRDAKYLLTLEPDRLLHRFRLYAGLEPKGAIYGGWESMEVSGHSLGHYLSACSLMYASTGDERFRARVTYVVDELKTCQVANGDGYVGGVEDGKRVFAEVAAGDIRSQGFDLNGIWVPWYTQHKLFAGLFDAHRHCDSDTALAVARKLGDWACELTANLSEELFQKMLACEHGGMNESLAELYALTGDQKYLRLSRRFHHRAVLDPLAQGRDCLPGLHGNTQIPKIIGVARRYEVTGDTTDRRIAEFFWDRVVHHHSYVTGGHGNHEYFGPPDTLNDRLTSNTTESCNTYNMLKLTRHLFAWHPSAAYADYYERALYSHILGSQNPDDGMMCYFVPLKSGEYKRYSNPFNNFTCCHGTGMENHAKYGDSIYFHDDESLYVNLFIPSELNWKQRGLTVRQKTRFPAAETVTLTFACPRPVELAVKVRCPGWAAGPIRMKVNGKAVGFAGLPGSYAGPQRTWRNGDTLEIRIPMDLRLEAMPDNAKRAAVFYGPVLLAGDLGPVELTAETAEVSGGPRIPVLVTQDQPPREWLRRLADRPLAFRTVGVGRSDDVTLIPFYEMHHRRYGVYWDFFTAEQWQQRQARYRAEMKRLRELAARTIDVLRIGEMQPERDHNVKGEHTGAGEFNGRKYRHATNGGWFSFEMKVLPDEPADLLCTYWGSDRRRRTFNILVDGTKIATQSLNDNRPGEFFDVTYPIPVELTRGKQKVTVRLQAHPDHWAGGLFGCRTMKRESRTGSDSSSVADQVTETPTSREKPSGGSGKPSAPMASGPGERPSSRPGVLPMPPAGAAVPPAVMQRIYGEVKTPYKYGVILTGAEGHKVDCPSVFRHRDKWYMMYIIFDGSGYETALAESTDLLDWKPLGKILRFREGTWDAKQAAGYVALQDHTWGGSYRLGTWDEKYWLSYVGGALAGYETDPLSIGIAWTSDPTRPLEWRRLDMPVLSRDQPDVRAFESLTQYKSNIIHDREQALGWPFVMFYNGKPAGGPERIGMAVSRDMKQWRRFGAEPVIDNGSGISGDPQIVRLGDVWVMFYFGAFWKPKAFDTFACSYNLVHWTKWTGPHLVEPSEPWDQTYAHKPWLIKHNGVVYHFYCAVGDRGRVIALATSKPMTP